MLRNFRTTQTVVGFGTARLGQAHALAQDLGPVFRELLTLNKNSPLRNHGFATNSQFGVLRMTLAHHIAVLAVQSIGAFASLAPRTNETGWAHAMPIADVTRCPCGNGFHFFRHSCLLQSSFCPKPISSELGGFFPFKNFGEDPIAEYFTTQITSSSSLRGTLS